MFVRLDDGPRPFDDILQAQRFVGGLQQQSFQNAAAVHEMQQQQALGEAQLDVARQRNDILGRETRMRSVGRAMTSAAKAGRALPAGVAGIQQMAAYLKQRNPEALAGVLAPFEGLPELPEGVDPLETEEGAALFEGLAGAWLAEQGAEAGEVASRVAVQAQTLMADPRAGLSDKDLEPLMALMEGGTATRAQIDAQYQAIRTKAAANIGFAEMRTAVLAEAQQAWGSAMTSLRAGSSAPLLGEASEADKLMELRGAIETATTPEELRAARGQYLVKAYGLDGVISEAEDAAFAAGEAAAMAAFRGSRDAALGRPQKAAPFTGARAGAATGGGAVLDPERFPNLARGVEAEAPQDASNAPLTPSDDASSIVNAGRDSLDALSRSISSMLANRGIMRGQRGDLADAMPEIAQALVEDLGYANDDALYDFLAQFEARYHDVTGETVAGREAKETARRGATFGAIRSVLEGIFGKADPVAGRREAQRSRGVR